MGLFSKSEYKEIRLPFSVVTTKEDEEVGMIDLEAYGIIDGEQKYCFASYVLKKRSMYENGEYEQIINHLKTYHETEIVIRLKYKRDKLKDFRIDIDELARICNDERIKQFDLAGWGLSDKSYQEKIEEYENSCSNKN